MTISIENANHLDGLLSALADPTRRGIVELLAEAPRTASDLHAAFPIAASAVSRHLRVLREAGAIVERPVPSDRRVRRYALAPEAVDEVARWVAGLSRGSQGQLDAFAAYVELRQGGPGAPR